MSRVKPIIQVAINTPLRTVFDYLPGNIVSSKLQPGVRVKVPFGRKQVVGVIISIVAESSVASEKLKAVTQLIDDQPLIPASCLQLLQWSASYYQYPIGEVVLHALPTLLRQGKPAQLPQQSVWSLTKLGLAANQQQLTRAPKQWQALLQLQQLQQAYPDKSTHSAAELNSIGIPSTILKILKNKSLVEETKAHTINKLNTMKRSGPTLNPQQRTAVDTILSHSKQFKSFLLQGVTGSGKTEVYLSVLEQLIAQGGQALVLVPEIGLTPQTVERFQQRLNCSVALLHSGLTDTERLTSWLLAKNGGVSVIIGTRSAIFTPFNHLRCIIVDESHDASYKQWEGFKYHARDLAVRRAQLESIPVVLGSATPSLASLHNVHQAKFTLLQLTERATGAVMPEFHLVDLRRQKLQHGIAPILLQSMQQHLAKGDQVLVFLNRRGFAPVVMCHDCGWVAECDRCRTPFTKHNQPVCLQCHHCGKQIDLIKQCPECNSEQLIDVGLGTQRIEQSLHELLPKYSIARIDRDTTRRKGELESALKHAHSGHAQILIGTQMIAKGHHFANVTLVVMLDVDGGLYSADYNASEHMAQLLLQVAGRAGREQKPGVVLLQTHHPDHPLLTTLVKHGYDQFAQQLLTERQQAQFPPYQHMVLFRVEAASTQSCQEFLAEVKVFLQTDNDSFSAFGPIPAPIEKRKGNYRWQLILLSTKRKQLHDGVAENIEQIAKLSSARKVRWSIDVDPISTL